MLNLIAFENSEEAIKEILEKIPQILPFDVNSPLSNNEPYQMNKAKIIDHWVSISNLLMNNQNGKADSIISIRNLLNEVISDLEIIDLEAAHQISNYLIRLEINDPNAWYEKGKIMFQMFVKHLYDNIDTIIDVFKKVIELGTASENPSHKGTTFWGYFYLGNIHLYKILTGEEALELALKFYNQGYRYAKTEGLEIDDEYIFDNVEVIQRILMNQFPLLLVVYNESGMLLYEYLFQFIEVMSQDQRFIPNFTALLSAVDEHIDDLFHSPVTSSYLVMKNRLLVISTIFDDFTGKWIKVAMIFSYLQQSAFNIDIDTTLLAKVNNFTASIYNNSEILSYLAGFFGKRDSNIEDAIEETLFSVFSEDLE